MSCVIGIKTKKGIWMGGDSVLSDGESALPFKVDKVFYKGDMLIGACGVVRFLDIFNYSFDTPEHPRGMGVDKYLRRVFSPALRACLVESGLVEDAKDEDRLAWDSLIGYKGRLFYMDSYYSICESKLSMVAIGFGAHALGAMKAIEGMKGMKFCPKEAIRIGLEVASFYNVSVGPPFKIKKLEKEK